MKSVARIAIVGAGPSGLFAAQALVAARPELAIDIFDRLPTPYGLLRYGVAPDHTSIKRVADSLAKVFAERAVRFVGNVELGTDVTRAELAAHYDAVIYALGASGDARLGVPGENLVGCLSAREFVAWYDGHPDAAPIELDGVQTAVVIGIGNVAVDVARILIKPIDDLAHTDIPDRVLDELRHDQVSEVWMVGRRGPAQTAFTPVELRELVNLDGVAVSVDGVNEGDWEVPADADRRTTTVMKILQEAAAREVDSPRVRLRFLFWHRVEEIVGDQQVEQLRLVSNRAAEQTEPVGADPVEAQLILRAIGYRGQPLPDLPFDEAQGVIPNVEGRMRDESGASQPGEYVVGWIKRGAVGVIGTNKSDAAETVAHVLADLETLAPSATTDDLVISLHNKGKPVADFAAWLRIDAAERERGERAGRIRTKVATWAELTELIINP